MKLRHMRPPSGAVLAAAFLLLAALVMLSRYTLHMTWKDAAIELAPAQQPASTSR
jgi:hypothetical protein